MEKVKRTPRKANAWLNAAVNAAEKNSLMSLDFDELEKMKLNCQKLIKLCDQCIVTKADEKEKELLAQLLKVQNIKKSRAEASKE